MCSTNSLCNSRYESTKRNSGWNKHTSVRSVRLFHLSPCSQNEVKNSAEKYILELKIGLPMQVLLLVVRTYVGLQVTGNAYWNRLSHSAPGLVYEFHIEFKNFAYNVALWFFRTFVTVVGGRNLNWRERMSVQRTHHIQVETRNILRP
jgi:hypothetical protein